MADIPRNQELSFVPSGKPQVTGRPTSKPRNQPNQWEDNYETIEGSFLEVCLKMQICSMKGHTVCASVCFIEVKLTFYVCVCVRYGFNWHSV